MSKTAKIKNEFNRQAEKLGCRARLAGTAKKPEFQILIGYNNGFEVVQKINPEKFAQITKNYPELRND